MGIKGLVGKTKPKVRYTIIGLSDFCLRLVLPTVFASKPLTEIGWFLQEFWSKLLLLYGSAHRALAYYQVRLNCLV